MCQRGFGENAMKESSSIRWGLFGAGLFLALHVPLSWALEVLTEENPPFNFTDNKKVAGQATEVVQEMARRASVPVNIQVTAWAKAYGTAQTEKDTCIYSTARLANRENIFKWIGPIATNQWSLYAKSGFPGKITSLKDARPYRVGGLTRDAKTEFLKQSGVTNIVEVDKDGENPPKLTLDRKATGKIDLWVTGASVAKETAKRAGVTDIQMVFSVKEEPLYLACSPRTSADVIKKLSAALSEMEKDGTLKKISAKYAPK
jgi:polar amino acid transport system substrate-binding protein